MDASELAMKMLEWEAIKRAGDSLTKEIQAAVLELGQTQTVGNVRARYSKGRRTYDHKAAIEATELDPDDLKPFERVTVDYRSACEELEITDIPFTRSPASVSVTLLS